MLHKFPMEWHRKLEQHRRVQSWSRCCCEYKHIHPLSRALLCLVDFIVGIYGPRKEFRANKKMTTKMGFLCVVMWGVSAGIRLVHHRHNFFSWRLLKLKRAESGDWKLNCLRNAFSIQSEISPRANQKREREGEREAFEKVLLLFSMLWFEGWARKSHGWALRFHSVHGS